MKKFFFLLTFTSLFISEINSQNFSGGFNFYLPPDDTASTKFLPQFPLKDISTDFISANNNGNFSVDGNPIRFWGTNLVADAAFPDKSKAWFIAGRLRKMGFNLVRFHHMDNNWGGGSLFIQGQSTRNLNPATLDNLEYLIFNLKKNNVYANINLNVSRTFNSKDGVEGADSLVDYAKGVTIFDPQLISLQKEYAKKLLTHVNPYTQLSLADDPVMAMVEIINENSLYRFWRDGKLKFFNEGGQLIYRHAKMLDSLWISFLQDKYSSTVNIQKAWNENQTPAGNANQILNGEFEFLPVTSNWILEKHETASAEITKDNTNPFAGFFSAKVNITSATGTNWHLQWKQINLSVIKDSTYLIKFFARSDVNKKIDVAVMRDNSPYTYYSGAQFSLTPEWKEYSFSFKANETNNGQTRLSFEFAQTGNFWFDNISLVRAGQKGLLAGESLENKNIKRIDFKDCVAFSDERVKDISEFYITLQNNFYSEMKSYLKDSLHVKAPIIGTNWNVGPADLTTQAQMDYIDNHAYWDHPQFPKEPWSGYDWLINNNAMVKADGGTIPDLFAGTPVVGKPYTVSEYNHAYPNKYQAEALMFTTAYCSFHNADGIMFFDYNSSRDWETDKINSYFSINRNPVMMSLSPSCAFAFRNNYISKAKETIEINYTAAKVKLLPKEDGGGWAGVSLFPKKLALLHSVRTKSFNAAATTDFTALTAFPVNPYKTDTEEITYDTDGILKINSPKFIGAVGFLNEFQNEQIGNLKVLNADGFAAFDWITLTDDSLSISEKSLFTISTEAQNSGMIWDGENTFHDKWGNAPTQVHPIQLEAELKINADSIRIFPLTAEGKANNNLFETALPDAGNIFYVNFDLGKWKTMWFGIEKFSNPLTTVKRDKANEEKDFEIYNNYPNPFNGMTTYIYTLPCSSVLEIEIYNSLGKRIRTLYNRQQSEGKHSIQWDGKNDLGIDVGSGIYLTKFSFNNFIKTEKIILLK